MYKNNLIATQNKMIRIITTKIKRIAFGMKLINEKLEIIISSINIICIIKVVQMKEMNNDKNLLLVFPVIFIKPKRDGRRDIIDRSVKICPH